MFVAVEVPLDVGIGAARIRLANLASGGILDTVSRESYVEHGVALLAVGPGRSLARLVRVRMRNPATHGDTTVLPLRWEAEGTSGHLFPVLDADLSLRPAGDRAVLRLDGAYRPPFGTFGAALDRALLHHVAQATIRAFIRQVAAALTNPEHAAASSPIPQLPATAQPQPETPAG